MIKAVIFDFFGVLATRGLHEFKKNYFKGDPAKIARGKALQQQMDRGEIGYDNFIDELAEIADCNRDEVLKYTEDYKPNQRLLDFIKNELKPKYKLGIISNSGADWVERIIGKGAVNLFDDIILSYKEGAIKPDAKIYKLSAGNLKVEPEECVFVDDIRRYIEGAEVIGMQGIWYRDFDQFKAELEKILATVSDN